MHGEEDSRPRSANGYNQSVIFLFFFACFLFLAAPLFGQQIIRVGVYENNPKIFTSESGKPAGIFVDIIEEIAIRAGWQLRFVHGTWSEGLDRLQRSEIDLMPDVAYTSVRSALFAYHDEPALSDWFQVYARMGSGIRGIPDLDGKRVSILDRSIQQESFLQLLRDFDISIEFFPFIDYTDVFKAVSERRTDAAITNRFFGARHMHEYGVEDTAIIFNPTKLFFAASKAADPILLQTLDRHLQDMKKDSESAYFRSIKKWTSEELPVIIPAWLKNAALLLAALTVLGGIASYLLKRQVISRTKELVQLFENAPLGIFLADTRGMIRKANPEALRILALQAGDVEGKSLSKHISCKTGSKEEPEEVSAWKKSPQPFHGEGRRKDGETLPLSCIAFPLIISGKERGIYTLFQDVSQQAANEKRIGAIIRDLNRTVDTLKKSWEQTVQVLASISEVRDPYTSGHQRRVAQLAAAIGKELGMDRRKARHLELAALIHDIGKIEIPSEILSKPGRLSDIEYRLIQTHPSAGHRILQSIEVPWPLAEIIYQHHERIDGSGYPRGLSGDEVLIEARIIAVADTVEAMSSHRPYRAAKGLKAALDEVATQRGSTFDPDVVDACLCLFREKGFQFEETAAEQAR